jgi:hypothetical protein
MYLTAQHAMRIDELRGVELSLAPRMSPQAKDVTEPGTLPLDGRIEAHEHLVRLVEKGKMPESDPVLLLSVRNVLSNLRAIGFSRNLSGPLAVAGEVFTDQRPYHVLSWNAEGRFCIEEHWPGRGSNGDRFGYFSGIPVLWDDESGEHLFHRMVSEVADPSHVWHLPRGHHPESSETSLHQWRELHEVFKSTLDATRAIASKEVIKCAESHGLKRETGYLHHVLGVDAQGRLCQYICSERLEVLGLLLRQRFGVRRALCVDNGGSVEVRLYPSGVAGLAVQLFAPPNFRPKGTSYLALALKDKSFLMLPGVQTLIREGE